MNADATDPYEELITSCCQALLSIVHVRWTSDDGHRITLYRIRLLPPFSIQGKELQVSATICCQEDKVYIIYGNFDF